MISNFPVVIVVGCRLDEGRPMVQLITSFSFPPKPREDQMWTRDFVLLVRVVVDEDGDVSIINRSSDSPS